MRQLARAPLRRRFRFRVLPQASVVFLPLMYLLLRLERSLGCPPTGGSARSPNARLIRVSYRGEESQARGRLVGHETIAATTCSTSIRPGSSAPFWAADPHTVSARRRRARHDGSRAARLGRLSRDAVAAVRERAASWARAQSGRARQLADRRFAEERLHLGEEVRLRPHPELGRRTRRSAGRPEVSSSSTTSDSPGKLRTTSASSRIVPAGALRASSASAPRPCRRRPRRARSRARSASSRPPCGRRGP